ncbi:MAG TPA: oxalurate catabolism protein HpxZ [Acidimicrobiales bacterium]|nr:oxalurate catabolism protein HpxZ [Acidimicrobiales bacterium]
MEVNHPEVVAEVRSAFDRYETAFVTNDVAVLDELFWASPVAVRFGAGENLYGHQAISEFRSRRPATDLGRQLLRVEIVTFGRDFAVASAEFRRLASGRTGRQQQSWVRTDDGWRIVAAQVSHLTPPEAQS